MTVSIAITGAGNIGDIHANAVSKHPETNLLAIIDTNVDKARSLAQKYAVPYIFNNLDELISSGKADAVVIGTPNCYHAPLAIHAMESGMHVLVEKPMAMNAQEAIEMESVSKRTKKTLMVAHCWRYDPEIVWLREQVVGNRLGKIFRTISYGNHTNWGPQGWFIQKDLSGGGALMDMGIHAIDTTRFLLGDPEPISVYAKISTRFGEYDVDDTGVIIITWKDGITSYIESGWWQPHTNGLEAATQLYGTKGFGSVFPTKVIPNLNGNIQDDRGEQVFTTIRSRHSDQLIYDMQMDHFINSIINKTNPNSSASKGVTNMKIITAAYQSSDSGEVIRINDN